MKPSAWIANLSLRKKLMIVFALVGLMPLSVTFLQAYQEIRSASLQSQDYAANQNYEQTLTALSGKMARMEKMSSMVLVNESIGSALALDPVTTDIGEQVVSFGEVSSYTQVLEASSEVNQILYYIDDRFAVTGMDTRFRKLSNVGNMEWSRKLYDSGGSPTWLLYEDESSLDSKTYLTLGRVLWNSENYQSYLGVVIMNLELKSIRESLTKSVPEQFVYLATEEGKIITSSGNMQFGTAFPPKSLDAGDRFAKVELAEGSYLVRSNPINNTGIYLVSAIPQDAAAAAVNKVGTRMIAVYLTVSVLLLLLIYPITGSMTYRVQLLTKKMDQVRKGWLQRLDIEPRDDEVGRLVSSYNYMIDNVQKLLREQYRLGLEKKGAELKALQSQINPHFLYNTLDMLIWMAQKEERENIQQIIYALSDYYKLTLNKGEDLVAVGDELRLCNIYVEIQQQRYKGKIKFEHDVTAEAKACHIPKITLQPLVENAIVHGISENSEGAGSIAVKGDVIGGRLILSIEDNGPGMKKERDRRAAYRGSGYGILNIKKRLELYFGEQNGLRFESGPEKGTTVIIDVPAMNMPDQRKLQ